MSKKRLSDDDIDNEVIRKSLSMPKGDAQTFKNISEQTWFRQYAKKSKKNLNKLTAKVKKGIKQGKFKSYEQIEGEKESGFEMPKVKKQKKSKQVAEGKKMPKVKPYKTMSKAEIEHAAKTSKSPTNRKKYEKALKDNVIASKFEITHGLKSKESKKYRERHGIAKPYGWGEQEL